MTITSRRDLELASHLVRKLGESDRRGVSLSSLAASANVAPARLEKLLRGNPKYFVRVARKSKYVLNRFDPTWKSEEEILSNLERGYRQHRQRLLVTYLGLFVSVVLGTIAIFQLK